MNHAQREIVDVVKGLVVSAYRIYAALPDTDKRFFKLRGYTLDVRAEWIDYDTEGTRDRVNKIRLVPSPAEVEIADQVFGWLAWVKQQDARGFRRLFAWASKGEATWRIAARERVSERTINYRIDETIVSIIKNFFPGKFPGELQSVFERKERPAYPLSFTERPTIVAANSIPQVAECYSGERRQFVRNGRNSRTRRKAKRRA